MNEERVMQIVNFNADMKRVQKTNRELEKLRLSKVNKADKQVERLYMAVFFLVIAYIPINYDLSKGSD
ncbi:hypothetical protein [Peptoniphilus obesi]|uniref:hypothetical protein n=1 Tax=Peptoniphilus obesi TaxID=1472765 RepID=UPI0004B14029|nr:hypothetical protein [Peptoniphilus obesi]